MIKSSRKYGTKKIRVALLSLITVLSVDVRFPELNQLLFKGILTFIKRALRLCKVND